MQRVSHRRGPISRFLNFSICHKSHRALHAARSVDRAHLDVDALLAKPTWSVRSLLPSTDSTTSQSGVDDADIAAITPQKLRHLLRLSALPPPSSTAEEERMLADLRAQLHFVRAIRLVDMTGVAPLRRIADETDAAAAEAAIGIDALRDTLEKEGPKLGRRTRIPRKIGTEDDRDRSEDWDVLAGASKKVGRYFVVEAGNGREEGQ